MILMTAVASLSASDDTAPGTTLRSSYAGAITAGFAESRS